MKNALTLLLIAAFGILLSGCKGAADVATVAPVVVASWPVTIQELGAYFCQLRCVDGSLPLLNPSLQAVRQQMGDLIFWQRYANMGSNSSVDAVEYGGNGYVLTWRFGDHFDLGIGAGGEFYRVLGKVCKIWFTQDGGTPGKQFFVAPGDGPWDGWVVCDDETPTGKWKDGIATLGIASNPEAKLPSYSKSYTRFRRELVTFDALVFGDLRKITLWAIISEHYDNATIESSSALERSFYAEGIGRAAWESWKRNHPGTSRITGTDWSAAPPGAGWVFSDGGNNMRFERKDGSFNVSSYGWP